MNLSASFNLEDQWRFFLKTAKLEESTLSPVLKIQMRRAFYSGAGQMLMLLKDEVADMPGAETDEALVGLFKQIDDFWKEEY